MPLTFVADPVIRAGDVDPALAGYLDHIDDPLDGVEAVEVTSAISYMLGRHAQHARPWRRLDLAMAIAWDQRDEPAGARHTCGGLIRPGFQVMDRL